MWFRIFRGFMKILHLYKSALPETYGGVETIIDILAHKQAVSGHDVDVVAVSKRARRMNFNGYRVIMTKQLFTTHSAPFSLIYAREVIRRARRADIVHIHFPYPFADLCVLLSGCNASIVVTYHSDIIRQKLLYFAYWPLMRFFLRKKADKLVATSQNYLVTSPVLDAFKAKTDVIPLGILDQNPLYQSKCSRLSMRGKPQLSGNETYFLFVGEFRYYKCLDVLIEAAGNVAARIVIIGSGPLEAALKSKAEKSGLKNVSFPGRLSDKEKFQYYSKAYAVVVPSCQRSEAFGITLIEGAMFGLPLISCEIGTGTSFVNIDHETGLVCPPNDPVALANAMNRLVADPDLADTFGRRARKRFEALFTAEKMTAGYDAVYAQLPVVIRNNSPASRSDECKPHSLMKFSIIIPVLNNHPDLVELLKTLEQQDYTESFETVIVDQSDIKEAPVEVSCGPCQWLHMKGRGAARSRNMAIRQAHGDWLVLVDANARFKKNTLQQLDRIIGDNPDYDVICGICLNMEDGKPYSYYSDFRVKQVNFENYDCCLASAMAIKRETLSVVGLFDEDLGTGARYGGSEETDLVLRILENGGKLLYQPWYQVLHPRLSHKNMSLHSWICRHYNYGLGRGAMLRKHVQIKPMWTFKHGILALARPAAGVLMGILSFRIYHVLRYAASIIGRLYGFISYRA